MKNRAKVRKGKDRGIDMSQFSGAPPQN